MFGPWCKQASGQEPLGSLWWDNSNNGSNVGSELCKICNRIYTISPHSTSSCCIIILGLMQMSVSHPWRWWLQDGKIAVRWQWMCNNHGLCVLYEETFSIHWAAAEHLSFGFRLILRPKWQKRWWIDWQYWAVHMAAWKKLRQGLLTVHWVLLESPLFS